ncbi:MAG: hypothetical protein JXA74_12350, partial [Anaerolineae bacterium]|nr:hypothetical protein [Anaerolineae bacterium]
MLALVIPVTALLVVALSLFHLLPGLIERHLLWRQPGSEGLPISGRGPVPLGLWAKVLGQRWAPGFGPMAWGLGAFPNMTWYLGVVPCLLGVVGLLRIRHWPNTLPLVGVLGVAMLLSAGPTIPLNLVHLLLGRIPWISQPLQNALHYVWPASLALAALAGLGVDRLGQILGMDWRASTIGQLAVGLGIMALVLIDFWPATQAYGAVYQYLEKDEIEAHLWLDAGPGEERYWVPPQPDRPGRRYTDTSYAIRYNRRPTISANEYHWRYAPHRAALFYGQALQGYIEEGKLPVVPQSILDLANVRYLVLPLWPARYEQALTGLPARGPWRVTRRDQHIALFENAQVWPYAHAYARGAYAITWEDKKLLESLPWFLARGYALVEAPKEDVDGLLGQGQPLQSFAADSPQAWPTVRPPDVTLAMARPKATEIWIRFEGEGPFLLMISETWYPHWRAYVNDARQPLLRLNGNYVGVFVNARAGHALFRYRRPFYLWLGWVVSALTAIGLLAYALRPQPVRLRPDA